MNTKTFFLPEDLTSQDAIDVMQEAYDWQIANANRTVIMVHYTSSVNLYPRKVYINTEISGTKYKFKWVELQKSWFDLYQDIIYADISSWTVVSVSRLTPNESIVKVLSTNNTFSYTPTSDYNPATKKYVDNEVSDCLTESKNYTDTKVISWASFGAYVNACKANGTRHDINLYVYNSNSWSSATSVETYTMQWLGWFNCSTYASRQGISYVKLNWELIHRKYGRGNVSDTDSTFWMMTLTAWDVIEVWYDNYAAETSADIVDYY